MDYLRTFIAVLVLTPVALIAVAWFVSATGLAGLAALALALVLWAFAKKTPS